MMRPAPLASTVRVAEIDLKVYEWPGQEPAVLLCHATGFHARCWDRVVARMPDRRCLAFDFRGHGGSAKPPPPYATWRPFGHDLAALARKLELRGAIGAGHSMGGHALTLAAALNPDAFSALVLIDPVIRPPGTYLGPWAEARFVAKRRNRWASPEEMRQHFGRRAPFSFWDEDVLRDYCDYGLAPDGNGGFVLACPPEIEASIYEHSSAPDSDIYREIESVAVPVQVIRSGRPSANSFETSPTAPGLAASFRRGTDLLLERRSHFIPMEAPEWTAERIRQS